MALALLLLPEEIVALDAQEEGPEADAKGEAPPVESRLLCLWLSMRVAPPPPPSRVSCWLFR